MHFNKKTLLTLLILPCLSHAQTWEVLLKSNMDKAYTSLEKKVGYCHSNRQPLKKITDDWFIKLSRSEKVVAASYIEYMADKDCWGQELTDYQSALLAYAAESGDKKALNEWITFSKIYRKKQFEDVYKTLNASKVMSWYTKQGNIAPFKIIDFLEQYPEFQHPELQK